MKWRGVIPTLEKLKGLKTSIGQVVVVGEEARSVGDKLWEFVIGIQPGDETAAPKLLLSNYPQTNANSCDQPPRYFTFSLVHLKNGSQISTLSCSERSCCEIQGLLAFELCHPNNIKISSENFRCKSVLRLPHSHAGNHQPSTYGNLTTYGDGTLP